MARRFRGHARAAVAIDYVVGIKPDAWVEQGCLKFTVAVLGTEGKPANAPLAVDFFQRNSYSHRRRLIGGFYA
jgi:hypothetical protein